jgi:uncharacterized protein (TIGR03067 family)
MIDLQVIGSPLQKSAPKTATPPDKTSDLSRLQGSWQVIKWEDESGEQVPAEELKQFTFSFDGDRLTMKKFKDDPGTKCQVRLDTSKQPKWVDLGMPSLEAGSTILEGIYSLDGDSLSLCFTSGQTNGVTPPRPTEFKTGPNEKYAVLSLRRLP